MQKNLIKIFFIFLLFSTFNSIEEIEYKIASGFISRIYVSFSVTFNRNKGIKAEYEKIGTLDDDINYKPKGKKEYNLTNEELGLPNMKELFKLFDKINFPEKTDWTFEGLFDVPVWNLIVDGKNYHSNIGTDFLYEFKDIINVNAIESYCNNKYDK